MGMLLLLAIAIWLPMLTAGQTEELVHDITCTPDANDVLPITLVNNYLATVDVTVNCSNNAFEYSMTAGELVILPAFFHDWTNPEKTYSDSACLLYQMDYNSQGYIIHVNEGEVNLLNDFHECDYSVGLTVPAVNHYSECDPCDSGIFTLQLENKAETWLFIAVACMNDWFTFHVPPNSSVSLPATFYQWTNPNKIYPNDTCIYIDWGYRYQDVVIYSIESDWDYALHYPGCDVSFGADVPALNYSAGCPANDSQFDVVLENNGDVWLYADVWCNNDVFWFYIAPNSQAILPAVYVDYYNSDKDYPNNTCVFNIWEPRSQAVLVYAEESDHDLIYEYISCNYSVGADVPQLAFSTDCEDPVSINFKNNGTVTLRVELWCWNDYYLHFLEPLATLSVPAVYRDWTNPNKIYPNDTCILWDNAPRSQTMMIYAEEADMDYMEASASCEISVGEEVPKVNHTSDCAVDSEGFVSVKLENTGLVWVYVEVICWNDYFQYYLSPGSTEIIPAVYHDWTNSDFTIPNDTCVFESYGAHYQEIVIYNEESDWDYNFEYVGCDYSVGSDIPKMDYLLECPDSDENFQIGFENTGDVWLYIEIDCSNGWVDLFLEPHTITHVDAVFLEWTDQTDQGFSNDVCVFDATDHRYQEVTAYTWQSDGDSTLTILWCDYSVGADEPQIDHKTNCVPDDEGEFTLNLVNTGDVWLYVELACWNDWLYYFLPPQSTINVPAIFNEWTNPEQVYPSETCVFEDWGDYQEIEMYNEEPDYDFSYSYLSCEYSVGEDVPAENHWTDCRMGNPGVFTVTLENPGNVWLYVSLECQNEMFEYYLAPNSNQTVPAAINSDQEFTTDTCIFYENADTAYIDSYSEEPDWDYTEQRITCRRELATRRTNQKQRTGKLFQPRFKKLPR